MSHQEIILKFMENPNKCGMILMISSVIRQKWQRGGLILTKQDTVHCIKNLEGKKLE